MYCALTGVVMASVKIIAMAAPQAGHKAQTCSCCSVRLGDRVGRGKGRAEVQGHFGRPLVFRDDLALVEASGSRYLAPVSMRTLPAGFIAPCLPMKAPRPPSGEAWLHEIKHDGFVARKEGNRADVSCAASALSIE
jgi:hypothetical protein